MNRGMMMFEVHGHIQRHLVRMRGLDVVMDLIRPVVSGVRYLLVRTSTRVWWGMRENGAER